MPPITIVPSRFGSNVAFTVGVVKATCIVTRLAGVTDDRYVETIEFS